MLTIGARGAAQLFLEDAAERNPYHLLFPAWMQDHVRRGGELVGGQGGAIPDVDLATLYRLRKWENGAFSDVKHSMASVDKITAAGFKPTSNFDEGLQATIEFFLNK